MNEIYEGIMRGLQEAIEDAAGRREFPKKRIGESGIPQSHVGHSSARTSGKERDCAKNE